MPFLLLKNPEATKLLVVFFQHASHDVEPVGTPLVLFIAQLTSQVGFGGLANTALEMAEVYLVVRKVVPEELDKLLRQV